MTEQDKRKQKVLGGKKGKVLGGKKKMNLKVKSETMPEDVAAALALRRLARRGR
jgi:hypothetical protein